MRKGENPSRGAGGREGTRVDELNERILPKGVELVSVLRPRLADRQHAAHGVQEPGRRRAAGVAGAVPVPGQLPAGGDRRGRSSRCRCSATFIGLTIRGIPANLLSLGAMDFGIIVDGAVIVVENIFRRLSRTRHARTHAVGQATDRGGGGGGRAADVLLDADHHHGAHPDLHAAAARGPHFRADGVHR